MLDKVKEFLGQGSFGEVYLVEHLRTKKVMAIKIIKIPRRREENQIVVKKIEKEIVAVIKLRSSSPFLVQLTEYFLNEKYFYIVMEFCSGGDLQKMLNSKKKLQKNEVLKLAYQLASGLKVLHNNGLIHRDLKPSNIFIGDDGTFKIGDFGTSCAIDLDNSSRFVGTNGYMAPEGMNSLRSDHKVDIFSLGCILYKAMTGQNPFQNENGTIAISKNATENYRRIESNNYPSELIELCHMMLNVNPVNRPSVEDILRSPLFSEMNDLLLFEINQLKNTVVALNKIIEEKDHEIEERNHEIEERNHVIEERDHEIEERNHVLSEIKRTIPRNNYY